MKKILSPKHTVIEQVAASLATTFYEVGRSQGLKSKYKDARSYSRAMFEKFIPKALEYCISMLGRQDIPELMKAEIYEALNERINDPEVNAMLGTTLPDIDISKLLPKQDRIPHEVRTVLHNPFLKAN